MPIGELDETQKTRPLEAVDGEEADEEVEDFQETAGDYHIKAEIFLCCQKFYKINRASIRVICQF